MERCVAMWLAWDDPREGERGQMVSLRQLGGDLGISRGALGRAVAKLASVGMIEMQYHPVRQQTEIRFLSMGGGLAEGPRPHLSDLDRDLLEKRARVASERGQGGLGEGPATTILKDTRKKRKGGADALASKLQAETPVEKSRREIGPELQELLRGFKVPEGDRRAAARDRLDARRARSKEQ